MKTLALLSLCGLALPMLATSAHAQVYTQTRSYNFINTFPLGADGDRPVDTADNADGSRYFLGEMDFGGTALAYLAKISPLGEATWITTLNGNGSTRAGAVASDADGNVYVSLTDDDGGYVRSYSSNLSSRWSTAHDPSRGLTDLVASSGGVYGAGSISNVAGMEGFSASDGSSLGVKTFGSDTGTFFTIKKDSKGCYYAGGELRPNFFLPRPVMAFWDPAHDFTDLTEFSLDDNGYGQIKEVCIDPTTDTAVANGFYQAEVESFPHAYMTTLNCAYDGTTFSKVADGIYQTAPEGGIGYSVAANDSGIYGAGFTDFPSGDYKLSATKTTIDPITFLPTRVWEDIVADDNATFSPLDVTFASNGNPIVYAASSKQFTIDGETFASVHQFQYGQDGTRISRVRLGNYNQRVRNFHDFGNDLCSNIGTTGMAFWSNLRNKTSISVTKFVDGPDETYKGSSTGDFSISSKLGVLRNEPNYFDLSPLTADLVPGSADGLGSLSLDPSGAFTATAAPGFSGYASFKYHAMQGAVDLGERTATLKIRPSNDPLAVDDSYSVATNAAKTFLFVRANDSDPNGAPIHVTSVSTSANASITISGDRQSVVFKPVHGFSGDVMFEYTISNPRGGTSTATVNVHVGP